MFFNNIPFVIDDSVPDDRMMLVDQKKQEHPVIITQETDEEREARLVADRLLGRVSGTLTYDMLNNAVDAIRTDIDRRVEAIVVSDAVRREYCKLIDADRRWGLDGLTNDGTFRQEYHGVKR